MESGLASENVRDVRAQMVTEGDRGHTMTRGQHERAGPGPGGRRAALRQVGTHSLQVRHKQDSGSVASGHPQRTVSGSMEQSAGGCCPQADPGHNGPEHVAAGQQGLRVPWRAGRWPAQPVYNSITLVPFQFFAFITTLFYVLHAFSIYYH